MAQYAQQTAARRFVETWKGRGYEKGDKVYDTEQPQVAPMEIALEDLE